MIVKILDPAGHDFPGVRYNEKKVVNEKGELMLMKNFPSFIKSNKEDVKNYLAAVSKGSKIEKPQFHATISTKFREHSKEELTKVAEHFMDEMGYGEQPFIVVFHNDTENNHVHIVTTRVDKASKKKINDSYEHLKSQKALSLVMEKLYGLNEKEKIEKLLGYRYGTLKQLDLLLERNGYRLLQNKEDENKLEILKNGVLEKSISGNELVYQNSPKNDQRSKQIKAILSKYKNSHSKTVFKVEDQREQEAMLPEEKLDEEWKPKIEFESELQHKLRESFGIDISFHHKDGQKPFGYTVIDHKSGTVYKGSDIMKMGELFEFSTETLDKKLFESLKDFNISGSADKKIVMDYLKDLHDENTPKDFMLFETKKRKDRETFKAVRDDVKEYLKTQSNNDIKIIRSESGDYYAIHSKMHYVGELEGLLGEKEYQIFLHPEQNQVSENKNGNLSKELSNSISDLIYQFSKSSGGSGKEPAENENKKRRKRKKR